MHDATPTPEPPPANAPLPESLPLSNDARYVMNSLFAISHKITHTNEDHVVHKTIRKIIEGKQAGKVADHSRSRLHVLAVNCAHFEEDAIHKEFGYIISTIQFMMQAER